MRPVIGRHRLGWQKLRRFGHNAPQIITYNPGIVAVISAYYTTPDFTIGQGCREKAIVSSDENTLTHKQREGGRKNKIRDVSLS